MGHAWRKSPKYGKCDLKLPDMLDTGGLLNTQGEVDLINELCSRSSDVLGVKRLVFHQL